MYTTEHCPFESVCKPASFRVQAEHFVRNNVSTHFAIIIRIDPETQEPVQSTINDFLSAEVLDVSIEHAQDTLPGLTQRCGKCVLSDAELVVKNYEQTQQMGKYDSPPDSDSSSND